MAELDFYIHIYGTKDAVNVEELSSADVVERKRGKWSGIPQLKTAKCPLCGKETDILIYNDGVLEGCRYCGVRPPIQTNADKLRSMTDEELAEFITARHYTPHCPVPWCEESAENCKECWLNWLRKEAK